MRNYSIWQWHLDEVFVKINGETHYLWRAVDHEGEGHCQRKIYYLPKRVFGIWQLLISLGFFGSDQVNLDYFKYSEFSSDSALLSALEASSGADSTALEQGQRCLKSENMAITIDDCMHLNITLVTVTKTLKLTYSR